MTVKQNRQLDLLQIPLLQQVLENLAAAPGGPVAGRCYWDTALGYAQIYTGAAWAKFSIPVAGLTNTDIAAGAAIAETKLSLASDAAAGTASRRTLGFGATQAMPGNARLDQIGAPTAAIGLGGQELQNLGAPSTGSSAARLSDVQAAQTGIDNKPSVRLASTGNVVIATNGLAAIDGVVPVAGDRILLKNQTTATENGSYIAAAGAWARSTDVITANSFWFVEEGTVNSDTQWMVTTNGAITLGTTALTIAQFGAPGAMTAGTGITIVGSTISLTAPVTVALGGTGATTAAGARTALGAVGKVYGQLGAITAGGTVDFVHNLGLASPFDQLQVGFTDATNHNNMEFEWKAKDANTITVGPTGVAQGANTVNITVIG